MATGHDRAESAVTFAGIRNYVAQTLRTAIVNVKIAPGTQLAESHFSTQFGVSRGLLREAIRELIETGLLVNRPYAGTYVADITEETMSDVYEVRRIMEKQAFIRMWPQRNAAFGLELTARYEALAEAAVSRELNRESAAEAHFHGLVYERCGNHLLLDVWRQMTQKIQLGLAVCRLPSHAGAEAGLCGEPQAVLDVGDRGGSERAA